MVMIAAHQVGIDSFLKWILFNNLIKGLPMSATTAAIIMYISTVLKYHAITHTTAQIAVIMIYFDSLFINNYFDLQKYEKTIRLYYICKISLCFDYLYFIHFIMRKFLSVITIFLLFPLFVMADEGMWLPSLISQRIGDMQQKGFKLTAEDIYSINQASLKDAVVLFGGGCTGELISNKGLLLTNHHCGYSQIQKHSSIEHDYLKDGFWAMTMEEELPNKGLKVSFLDRMEDVTNEVLKGYSSAMTEIQRDSVIRANSIKLIEQATANDNSLKASVEALYYGNQYFIFVFRVFSDVRLVGAPPSSIGKFGGDTDNWMWPRHTGDFSIFRIYADRNNNPAEYSEENIPYTPKKYFKISSKGVNEGDFTFVYGFPGSTREYITSDAVRYIAQVSNPHKIMLRTHRLEVQNKYMSKDQAVRIMYSSKNANVANAWKKWQGEMKGINKMGTVQSKMDYQERFRQWAKGGEYEGVLEQLEKLYLQMEEYSFATDYYAESVNAIEITRFAAGVKSGLLEKKDFSDMSNIISMIDAFYKDYYLPIDKEIFVRLLNEFSKNVPDKFKPDYFFESMKKYGSIERWADSLYTNTIFANKERVMSLGESWTTASDSIANDPAVVFAVAFADKVYNEIRPIAKELNGKINLLYRDYMRGQMAFEKDKIFYPDANLTLRVAYGNVAGYVPADGIYYSHSSTLEGIMQKDNPNIFDYDIPQKLRDLYATKDYGRWEENGTVPVCFIATNHTSGGNSGSPVINERGELIGINFDRVWEGTMSDVVFDPQICRNISLDIRYVLFVVDKLAGAQHLIDEMVIK